MSSKTATSTFQKELQHKIDTKTKPPGSLGRLEAVALQVGMIQRSLNPVIRSPYIVVFAGDHGIAATGLVNPYPQQVTAQMVLNFINGGAAINAFCKTNDIKLQVVDAGVNADLSDICDMALVHAKISYGTRNYLEQPTMTAADVNRCIEKGKEIVENIHHTGCNCIGFGEMGIGNSSAASLIMSLITGLPIEECTGRGTGVNDEQLQTKIMTLRKVHEKYAPALGKPPGMIEVVQAVGGFEIAMMTGAYIKAAELNMIIVVDGFIATSALLLALTDHKSVLDNCIFAHTSGEQGHEKMLDFLDARPLLNLEMRLGEGTGAAMAIPLIRASVNFLNEMASFETAAVSSK